MKTKTPNGRKYVKGLIHPKVTWAKKRKEGITNDFKSESGYGSYGGSKKRKKEKGYREILKFLWIQIWIEGNINLLDWESEHDLFHTPLKNDGSYDLAAPDKEARRISM